MERKQNLLHFVSQHKIKLWISNLIFLKYLITRYAEYWQKFLCFYYRSIGDEETYGVEFLDEQHRSLWDLKTSLELDVIDDEILDRKVFVTIIPSGND